METIPADLEFAPSTLEKRFRGKWTSTDTKISKDALKVAAELLRIFVVEAVERSAMQVVSFNTFTSKSHVILVLDCMVGSNFIFTGLR